LIQIKLPGLRGTALWRRVQTNLSNHDESCPEQASFSASCRGISAFAIGAIDRAYARCCAARLALVFKAADELRRFDRLARQSSNSDAIEPLLACRAPQGSQIEVFGSGYRAAFIKIIDGPAFGCERTVPLARVQER
jgi:hypothetical protein